MTGAAAITRALSCGRPACSCVTSAKEGHGRTHCVAHDDRTPSLSVTAGDAVPVIVRCFAGCSSEQVIEALKERSLWPEGERRNGHAAPTPTKPGRPSRRTIVATYPYADEDGKLLFEVLRYQPKAFSQRRPDPERPGAFISNLDGITPVLYRLPELVAADPAATVWLVEGERDVDRLRAVELVATTAPMGAGKWRPEYTEALAGRRIAIVPDNDPIGEKHAQAVAASLVGIAASVKVVRLPGLPPKGDVSDYVDLGHGAHDLAKLYDEAAPWSPPVPAPTAGSTGTVVRLADVEAETVAWVWPAYLPSGKTTVLEGDPGQLKSTIAFDLAARVTTGGVMPDGSSSDLDGPRGVVLLVAEDGLGDTVRPRLEAAGADLSKVVALTEVTRTTTKYNARSGEDEPIVSRERPTLADLGPIRDAVRQVDAALVIVDPLTAFLPEGTKTIDDASVRRALMPVAQLAQAEGFALLVVRHLNKSGGSSPMYRGAGSIGITATARSVLLVTPDPSDPDGPDRFLAPVKTNLVKSPMSLRYRAQADERGRPRIEWLGEADLSARKLLAVPLSDEDAEERGAVDDACDVLRQLLGDGPVPSRDVEDQAKEAGISGRTLKRARARLGVRARRLGFGRDGTWTLSLPEGDDQRAPVALDTPGVAPFGDAGTLWADRPAPDPPSPPSGEGATGGTDTHRVPRSPKGANPEASRPPGPQCDSTRTVPDQDVIEVTL